MKTDMKTGIETGWASSRSARRRVVRCAFVCVWFVTGGCSLLENEFTWLDRIGPALRAVPDAPVSGTLSRP